MSTLVAVAVDGIIYASWLFVIAAGLTMVYGVMRILNMAHGSLYALGAYAAASLVGIWVRGGHPPFGTYAMRLLGDETQAEECVADTFSRFLTALKNGGGPQDHLQAYMYRVAHNWITDVYRRSPLPALPLDEDISCKADGPAQTAASRLEREQVRAAVACLTPDQRQVVVAFHFSKTARSSGSRSRVPRGARKVGMACSG